MRRSALEAALSGFATCPQPPRQRQLELAVRAGKKNYVGL